MSTSADQLAAYFSGELVAASWESSRGANSTTFRKDRCLVVVAANADGTVLWNVFPTPPQLPAGVMTRPSPIPLGTFKLAPAADRIRVDVQSFDRNGRFVIKPFFEGDAPAVFRRLMEETVQRIDAFVRFEQAP